MINGAKYGAKKSPELCSLGLNPSFQRMEETISAFNKIEKTTFLLA
jgi:hypothetical protein